MENRTAKLVLLGGLSAASLITFYILFGPNKRSRPRKKDCVPGLENLGNSCFINAVLQCLAPCTSVTKWLSRISIAQKNHGKKKQLSSSLLSTLNDLNNEDLESLENQYCSPLEVLTSLRGSGWMIKNEEQDAHELFHVLTTTLDEEVHAQSTIKGLNLFLDLPTNNTLQNIAFRSQSPVKLPLNKFCDFATKGLTASRLTCKSCGFENPLKYDVFDSISLPIPENYWGMLRLEDCLKNWLSSEMVHGVTCDSCSKMHSPEAGSVICKSTFVKQLSISKLPDCLCLHFVRTIWSGNSGAPKKRFDHVTFPEILCMDDYLNSSKKNKSKKNIADSLSRMHSGLMGGSLERSDLLKDAIQHFTSENCSSLKTKSLTGSSLMSSIGNHIFHLKSVVVHLGDTFSGHFITYRLGPVNSRNKNAWFYTSDTKTYKVSFSEISQAIAYLLIYERITPT